MFESISTFVGGNLAALAILAVCGLAFAAYLSQMRFRLWVRDFWVTLPFVGDLASLAKDRTQGNHGWLRAEEKLCAIYKPFIEMMTAQEFNKRIEYLRKSADLGRTPTPMFVWTLLVVLVIAEGLGFSYLLGSWMAREGSASTHTLLMFAIVLVLCVIMVALTHYAGHQYYRTSLLRSCFARFKDLGTSEYAVETISLAKDQALDDKAPEFKQIVNRVAKHSHDKGSYGAGILAIIAIVFIGVGSTYMRVKNLEGEMIRESAALEQSASDNPFAKPALPAEVVDAQKASDDKARAEAKNATKDEGIAAFAMLGFIFVITQIVGMGAGYKYGFAGRESDAAFQALGGFSTYQDYIAYFQPLRDLVNGRLKDLQQRIEEKSHTKLNLNKTFNDYLLLQRQQLVSFVEGMNEPSPQASASLVAAQPAPQAVSQPVVQSELTMPAPTAPVSTSMPADLAAVQAEIVRLNNPDAEKTYFLSLPTALRNNPELQAWLKQRKSDREAAAQASANELF